MVLAVRNLEGIRERVHRPCAAGDAQAV